MFVFFFSFNFILTLLSPAFHRPIAFSLPCIAKFKRFFLTSFISTVTRERERRERRERVRDVSLAHRVEAVDWLLFNYTFSKLFRVFSFAFPPFV